MTQNKPASLNNPSQASTSAASQIPLTITGYDNVTLPFVGSGFRPLRGKPAFSGTGTEGETITLYRGEEIIGTATVGTNGQWKLELDNVLSLSDTPLVARSATQQSSNVSIADLTTRVPVTIDYANEDSPNGGLSPLQTKNARTDDTRPTFSGSAGAGQIVTLYAGEKVLGSVQAGANGRWDLEITTDLPGGMNSVIAQTEVHQSNAYDVIVRVREDMPLIILGAWDDTNGRLAVLENNDRTKDVRPSFTGYASRAEMVSLFLDGKLIGMGQANHYGEWNVTLTEDLPYGAINLIARSGSKESEAFNLIIESPSAQPVTISNAYVIDENGDLQYISSGQGSTQELRPTFTGTAGAKEIVTLSANGIPLGSTQADDSGNWSLEINSNLASGNHAVIARTESSESDAFSISVDSPADMPVTIDIAYDNVGITQTIYNNSIRPTDDTRPTFSGKAGAGQLVTLYSGETELGSVRAGNGGFWTLEISTELTSGRHAIIARTENQESRSFTVNVQAPADVPVTITYGIDNVGQGQYLYSNTTAKTDDTRPTFYGRASPGHLVTLYSGEIELGSVRADAIGHWSLEITTDLTSGSHAVTARTETRASENFILNIESPADVPVTITYAIDNVGKGQYLYSNGSAKTDDTRPTFYGTGGVGQLVTLSSGETVLGSVRVGANGSWSLEITTELPSGSHGVIARTENQESRLFIVNVESAADVPVIINSAYDNVGQAQHLYSNTAAKTDDTRPTFSG